MPAATAGLFIIDFFLRPFAKICEKSPWVMLIVCLIVYGFVAYVVLKSTFLADQHQ
jgi:hypothetical protein